LTSFWDWLSAKIEPAVASLTGWFRDEIQPALAGIWEAINGSLIPALSGLWDFVIGSLIPALAEMWSAINVSLIPALSHLWEFIKVAVIPIIKEIAENVLVRMWDALQILARIVLTVAVPAMVAIAKHMVETALAIVETGIKIAAFVVTAVTRFGELSVGVGRKISEVIELVSGIAGRALAAIGNLGSTLYDAGRALISGLLNGIKDGLSAVWTEVSSIAGKIAELKGPLPYDRTVLVPAGRALMQGLASGIDQGLGQVEQMVSGIAPSLSMQLTPAATSGASRSGPTVIVQGNVYGPGGARWLAEELRSYEAGLR